MQICVWRLVGNISFSQIAFVGEPFSLTTVTRFLRGEREKWGGPQGPRPLLCNLHGGTLGPTL